jgi:hypothetical protein
VPSSRANTRSWSSYAPNVASRSSLWATPVLAQHLDRFRVQRYDALGGLGLSGPNVQRLGVEIDVEPPEREQLATTQPPQQRDPPQRVQAVVVGRLEEPAHLGGRPPEIGSTRS